MILFNLWFSCGQPTKFLNYQADFFDQIHLGCHLPSNILCQFEQNLLWIYATGAIILFLLGIVEKFGLMTKYKWFYDISRLFSTLIYLVYKPDFVDFERFKLVGFKLGERSESSWNFHSDVSSILNLEPFIVGEVVILEK